jgi:hypothetical protein
MRISFDLDDTLICYRDGVAGEPRLPWYLRWFIDDEPLRLGAPALMCKLQARGWEVCIYTTSQRNPAAVRRWLQRHGVRASTVINKDIHDLRLRRGPQHSMPSKNPAAFGIDLHVDDSDGVQQEGEKHGFRVVVVSPDDPRWVEKVLLAAAETEAELREGNRSGRSTNGS